MEDYHIIASLSAHDGPVRCMSESKNGRILTGCQSGSPHSMLWNISVDSLRSCQIQSDGLPQYHDNWVVSCTFVDHDNANVCRGSFITGCYDSFIRIFEPSGNLQQVLQGHTKGVISFGWTSSFHLLSGSWDGTCRIWDLSSFTCLHVLGPHENGVTVLGLPNGLIVTSSTGEAVNNRPANYKIRCWSQDGSLIGNPIEDHGGPIRSLCYLPELQGFASSSNDGTVCIRDSSGNVCSILRHPLLEDGTPPIILHCQEIPNQSCDEICMISCSENGSVFFWKGETLMQVISHPCCVWCVLPLHGNGFDGDFLTGGNDGVIRWFSCNSDRFTDVTESLEASFICDVEVYEKSRRQGPSQEEINKATPWGQRGSFPGKSEGAVMVFNKDGVLIAAQWESASRSWIEVGEVTGSDERNGGQLHGVEYDYILPVEIETSNGLRTLKMGHNIGDNPFVSAQRFIDQNELSQHYLSQIADFISANTKSGAGHHTLETSQDSYVDPTWNKNTSVSASPAATKRYSGLSQPPLVFDAPISLKALEKLEEFNRLEGEVLTSQDLMNVKGLLQLLANVSFYHSSEVEKKHMVSVLKMLTWKDGAHLFPLFDILRLICLHHQGAHLLAQNYVTSVLDGVVAFLQRYQPSHSVSLLTLCRFLSNAFKPEVLRLSLISSHLSHCSSIFKSLKSLYELSASSSSSSSFHSSFNSNLHSSISILTFNFSFLLHSLPSRSDELILTLSTSFFSFVLHILDLSCSSLDSIPWTSELVSRYLMALGIALSNPWLNTFLRGSTLQVSFTLSSLSCHTRWRTDSLVAGQVTEIQSLLN